MENSIATNAFIAYMNDNFEYPDEHTSGLTRKSCRPRSTFSGGNTDFCPTRLPSSVKKSVPCVPRNAKHPSPRADYRSMMMQVDTDAISHMVRKMVEERAAMPPVVTAVRVRITDPGLRFRMAAYDATHVPARGVIVDGRY